MNYENLSVEELEKLVIQKRESISDMASTFNPDFSITTSFYSSEVKFFIRHKTKNWSDLIDVSITNSSDTKFSHGSGAWNRDKFCEEDIMNSCIEGFLIARSIMQMKNVISSILKEIGRIEHAKSNVKYNQEVLERNKAQESISAHLNANYKKASAAAILSTIRSSGSVEIIRPGRFIYSSKEFSTDVICIKDINFNEGSRLNLYSFHYYSDEPYSEDMPYCSRNHITIANLDRICSDSYIFNKEVYEKSLAA